MIFCYVNLKKMELDLYILIQLDSSRNQSKASYFDTTTQLTSTPEYSQYNTDNTENKDQHRHGGHQ